MEYEKERKTSHTSPPRSAAERKTLAAETPERVPVSPGKQSQPDAHSSRKANTYIELLVGGGSSGDGGYALKSGIKEKKVKDGLKITGYEAVENGELYPDEAHDGIQPRSADQGSLADCYVVSSLASVAMQNPQVIRDAISGPNPDGSYTVTLYEWSFWSGFSPVQINVTAEFPTGEKTRGGTTSTVKPHIELLDIDSDGQVELWAALIEKAYAHHLGEGDVTAGYEALSKGGSANDFLETLTGVDSESHDPDDLTIEEFEELKNNDFAVTFLALAKGDGEGHELYDNGTLAEWHYYYLADVDVSASVVILRNPWGWGHSEIRIPLADLEENFRRIDVNPLTSAGD